MATRRNAAVNAADKGVVRKMIPLAVVASDTFLDGLVRAKPDLTSALTKLRSGNDNDVRAGAIEILKDLELDSLNPKLETTLTAASRNAMVQMAAFDPDYTGGGCRLAMQKMLRSV